MTFEPSKKTREDYRIVELQYLGGKTRYMVEEFGSFGGCQQWNHVLNPDAYWTPAEFKTKEEAQKFIDNCILIKVTVV